MKLYFTVRNITSIQMAHYLKVGYVSEKKKHIMMITDIVFTVGKKLMARNIISTRKALQLLIQNTQDILSILTA